MKEILFGCISGIVAALGMGGGTILILLLGIFTSMQQHLIQGTNLVFFIPTAIIAIFMNIKNKTINYKLSIYLILSGVIGAITGSLVSFQIESKELKKYFGIFLLFVAALEIYSFVKQNILQKRSK